jgi:hypothetical protein
VHHTITGRQGYTGTLRRYRDKGENHQEDDEDHDVDKRDGQQRAIDISADSPGSLRRKVAREGARECRRLREAPAGLLVHAIRMRPRRYA